MRPTRVCDTVGYYYGSLRYTYLKVLLQRPGAVGKSNVRVLVEDFNDFDKELLDKAGDVNKKERKGEKSPECDCINL